MSAKNPSQPLPPEAHGGRRRFGRAQSDHIVDSYKQTGKLPDPAFCTQCGAVYERGRWHWKARPEAAQPLLCPACHRTNDHFPAGIITLTGEMIDTHKDEMIRLIRHQEAAEKSEHPLNRVMAIDDGTPGRLEISTTDIHLPRRIGDALEHAFNGKISEHFDDGGYFVRVNWHRDA